MSTDRLTRVGRSLTAVVALVAVSAAACSSKPSPSAPTSTLGVDWIADAANPQPLDGVCPGWHCAASGDPALARAPDGSLSLWFTTIGIVTNGTGGYVSQLNIGHATAADTSPLSFTPSPDQAVIGSPIADGAWDRYLETVTVLHDDAASRWNLWFLGYAELGFTAPAIGEMQSLDAAGTSWTRPSAPIYRPTAGAWDSAFLSGPTAMKGPDGIWRLYYSGVGSGGTAMGLLTSTDGQSWTPSPSNPVFAAGGSGAWDESILEQSVRYADGQYWLFYSGYRGTVLTTATTLSIGLATSTDGVHWSRHAGNPVLQPGPSGSWDDLRVLAPDVVVEPDGSFLMAAYGQSTTDPTNNQPGRTGFWRSH